MAREVPLYGEWADAQNAPLLARGIAAVDVQYPDGISRSPRSFPALFTQEVVVVQGDRILACSPCAVANSVSGLGIDPKADIDMLAKRLWAAQQIAAKKQELPLLAPILDGNRLAVTSHVGMERLLGFIKRPLAEEPLALQAVATEDMGTVHQALANGYTGVYIDQPTQHAISIVGMHQDATTVYWELLPPDRETIGMVREISPTFIEVQIGFGMVICLVDPQTIMDRTAFPMWIMSHTSNPWIPPTDEMGEIEDIGTIIG